MFSSFFSLIYTNKQDLYNLLSFLFYSLPSNIQAQAFINTNQVFSKMQLKYNNAKFCFLK